MRNYAKIEPSFWIGETGRWIRAQGKECLIVAFYLMTCPNASMIGLYYLPIVTLAHETGLTVEETRAALRRLSQAPARGANHPHEGGFAWYDEENEVVWVPQMARYQNGDRLGPKDNNVKAIQREAEKMRKSVFFAAFHALYNARFGLNLPTPEPTPEPTSEALPSASPPPFEAPSKPLRRGVRSPDQAAHPPSEGGDEGPAPCRTPSEAHLKSGGDASQTLRIQKHEPSQEHELDFPCAEPSGPRPVGPARHPLSQARPRPPQPPRAVARAAKDPEPAATTPIWNAYADAYERRYGVRPDRTYQCNITLQRILDRLPAEIAPQVAAFYVASPEAYYVQLKHPLELLEKQSQKVLTEWKTKTHGSATKAREAERTASNAAALYARELERKEGLP